ncbi:MAG: efflux RND transporter periplasmic adaptor subunit [Chlorobiaceae bacterium]
MKSDRSSAGWFRKSKLIPAILFISAVLLAFWLFGRREPAKVKPQGFFDSIPVSVTVVSKAAVRDSFSLVGTVEAFREADIYAETAGILRKVLAGPGDRKKVGEGLLHVDDELASARLKKAEAHYRQSSRDVERYGKLYEEGAVALSAFESAQLQKAEAEAEYTAATRKQRDATVAAPFSGVVTARFVEQGELVREGMKVAHMVDMAKVKVIVFVPERELAKFHPGLSLTVTSDLNSGERFKGTVSTVSDKSGRDHTCRVEVVLSNPSKNAFRSGMFARVLYEGGGSREAILVPRSALVSGIRKPELFVVEGGKAVLRKVVAGMEFHTLVEVTEGVAAGEQVVTSGQEELKNGSRVTLITEKKSRANP